MFAHCGKRLQGQALRIDDVAKIVAAPRLGNVPSYGLCTPEVHGRSVDRRFTPRRNELLIHRQIEVRAHLQFVIENQAIPFPGEVEVRVVREVDGSLRICGGQVLLASRTPIRTG